MEHDLREELDLNMNNIRQMERRLEASQETIVDQQQTIEKFRELVRQLQVTGNWSVNGIASYVTYHLRFRQI